MLYACENSHVVTLQSHGLHACYAMLCYAIYVMFVLTKNRKRKYINPLIGSLGFNLDWPRDIYLN